MGIPVISDRGLRFPLPRQNFKCEVSLITEYHATKAYMGFGGIAPHILSLCSKFKVCVQL
jgi:hypothetical protein